MIISRSGHLHISIMILFVHETISAQSFSLPKWEKSHCSGFAHTGCTISSQQRAILVSNRILKHNHLIAPTLQSSPNSKSKNPHITSRRRSHSLMVFCLCFLFGGLRRLQSLSSELPVYRNKKSCQYKSSFCFSVHPLMTKTTSCRLQILTLNYDGNDFIKNLIQHLCVLFFLLRTALIRWT